MKKFLFGLLLALTSLLSSAAIIAYNSETLHVRVDTSVPCPDEALSVLRQMGVPPEVVWYGATVVVGEAAPIKACVAGVGDSVYVFDENGNAGSLPRREFHTVKEI